MRKEGLLENLKGKQFLLSKEQLDKLFKGDEQGYEYTMTKEEIVDAIRDGAEGFVDKLEDGEILKLSITVSPISVTMVSSKKKLNHPDKSVGIRMEEWE